MRIISHKEHKELKEKFIFGDGRGGGFRGRDGVADYLESLCPVGAVKFVFCSENSPTLESNAEAAESAESRRVRTVPELSGWSGARGSRRARSNERKDFQGDGLVGLGVVNELANPFGCFAREGGFATPFADLRWDVLDEDAAALDREHFGHELGLAGSGATDVATKRGHGHLRFP
jgi:hypothetical protein